MTKKIGVLTFHNAVNYGAALQAYALERYIEKKGVDSELIDYQNPYVYREPTLKWIWKGKNLVWNVYNTVEYPFWYKRYKKFETFIHKVNVSNKYETGNFSKYSCLLVGSDQVWNLNTTHGDFTYYLKGVKDVRKCSYASSFGTVKLDDKYMDDIRNSLQGFDVLTVRENSGKKFINELLPGRDVELVLDPTFLLTRDEWRKILVKPKYNEKYILIYQLAYSKPLIHYAQLLAKARKCKLITINGNPRQPFKGINVLDAGPDEWLGLVEGAEMVLTNSFHGTVFSIIFQKNFYTSLLTDQAERNDRVMTLLTELGLEDRILLDEMNLESMDDKIDYSVIDGRLNRLINTSYNCLDKVIDI